METEPFREAVLGALTAILEAVTARPAWSQTGVTLVSATGANIDVAMLAVIEERDEAQKAADNLTAAVAEFLGANFGEHTNDNEPWTNAIDAISDAVRRPAPLDADQHATMSRPGWEYNTTTGPRKAWSDADTSPCGDGWVRNIHIGDAGFHRGDYHEESYWMRPDAAALVGHYQHVAPPNAGPAMLHVTGHIAVVGEVTAAFAYERSDGLAEVIRVDHTAAGVSFTGIDDDAPEHGPDGPRHAVVAGCGGTCDNRQCPADIPHDVCNAECDRAALHG